MDDSIDFLIPVGNCCYGDYITGVPMKPLKRVLGFTSFTSCQVISV